MIKQQSQIHLNSEESKASSCFVDPLRQHIVKRQLSGAKHCSKMGCVSSKQLHKQALSEEKWGKVSPGKRKPTDKPSHNELSLEEYHRHLVALTSSSYGLLKMDTPKSSEESKRCTDRTCLLDDLYDRLDTLESMKSAPDPLHEMSNVLQTFKPDLQRSISTPVQHSSRPTVHETINVSEIMQGLEEGASSYPSPSKDVELMAASTNKLLSPPPHHLQGRFQKSLPLVIQKRTNGASQDQHILTNVDLAPNKSKETLMENRSLHRDLQPSLSTKLPSGVSYATSSRRLKLTLNLEYENTLMTGMQMNQDACNSAGSSARRSIVDALTEPGSPLFDPALLASYEKALQELRKEDWSITDDTYDLFEKMRLTKETQMAPTLHALDNQSNLGEPIEEAINPTMMIQLVDPLNEFEWRCPPSGEETIVLYTTTLHGIRKTFEDCNNVRNILKGYSVGLHERDVSMHSAYRDELRELLGGRVTVPSVFIKGRYIGGVDDVTKLHEDGKLAALLKGLPKDLNNDVCDGCGNMRFVPCLACSGSCKVVDRDNILSRCPECNENGLMPCPICS